MIQDGLREIRRALLEADVNYRVTRDFLNGVREKALGERVLKAVSPGQQIVKIVHDELAAADRWGRGDPARLVPGAAHGDHAGGAAGVGEDRHRGQAWPAADPAGEARAPRGLRPVPPGGGRPAAGAGQGAPRVPVHHEEGATDPVEVAKAAHRRRPADEVRGAHRRHGGAAADRRADDGRAGAHQGRRSIPREILLVADAMTGQEAVRIAGASTRHWASRVSYWPRWTATRAAARRSRSTA